ncbi:MAG: PHP domain-containing protein [bacterium]|nr:PHP domain-containing protein [bacterium]
MWRVDLHTHSVASGHAYSTVAELAEAGAATGLEAIGITDHGPGLPQGPHVFHFSNLYRLREWRGACALLPGVEEDLAGPEGELYLPEEVLKQLDIVLVGVHPYGWAEKETAARVTRSLLKAMENPLVKGVTHPVNTWLRLDVKEIVKAAKDTHTAVELNLSKVAGLESELRQFLEWVEDYEAPLMVNSDAHIAAEVGCWGRAAELLPMIPMARVINRSLAAVCDFFGCQMPRYANEEVSV